MLAAMNAKVSALSKNVLTEKQISRVEFREK